MNKSILVDKIIQYEAGELKADQTIKLFAYLIKTGQAWTLQGHYGRTAMALIEQGFIDRKGQILKEIE